MELQLIATPLVRFLEMRAALAGERIGDGGPDTTAALTNELDRALGELGADLDSGAAVVALGGYGRREQCLWSDVDIMLLHRDTDPDPLVRAVLYPLWDAGLKVGHAVRTVADSRAAAREDFKTLTSLLSARFITGDPGLFDELTAMVADLVRSRPLATQLVMQERERRDRNPYPTMAADVKEGRGALRTHQGLWWERRRGELLGLQVDEPSRQELEARTSLLAIRNALHANAGRAQDRFLLGLREGVALWLDTDVPSVAAKLTAALHTGDAIADQRWPDIHVEQDPMIGFGRRIFGAIRSRFSTADEPPTAAETPLTIAVKAAARRGGARFERAEDEAIKSAPMRQWTASDRTAFLTLLSAGARGRTIFGRLEQLGWVDREFPEWGPVSTAPQLAPFHDHPVGAHLWRAADEMFQLIEGGGASGAIADEVGSTEELLLAAFLHDIGKARGGNHAVVGAELATRFLRRVGFGPATVGVVADAVRLHLLLSETAVRRDIADLAVIDDVAAQVGDLRRLNVLYLLTIADLRATGTTMWNEWRAILLRKLYERVHEAIETGTAPPATRDIDTILAIAPSGVSRRAIEEHVDAMPEDYLDTAVPAEILWHLDVAAGLEGPAVISVDPLDPTRVLVAGADRMGFLLAVSRAFAANGVEILDARLRTRSDGIALDTFHVGDDQTGAAINEARWEEVAQDLSASLTGNKDLRQRIRERVKAYQPAATGPDAARLRTRRAGRFTAIEIKMPDRVGLLTHIVEALHGEGLDIHLAKIDTIGGEARDTFHVRQIGGAPVRSDAELEALRGRLQDRLRG